jgi:hypothetical protein
MLWSLSASTLAVREDPLPTPDPEPAHPQWPGHRLVGSAPLLAGAWRVGAWVRPDGVADIARFRPGDEGPPITLMTSTRPIFGVFYLGLPDAVGGTLFFAEKVGKSHYRLVSMGWSEAGLRTAGQ